MGNIGEPREPLPAHEPSTEPAQAPPPQTPAEPVPSVPEKEDVPA
jgi:hypothetical protein